MDTPHLHRDPPPPPHLSVASTSHHSAASVLASSPAYPPLPPTVSDPTLTNSPPSIEDTSLPANTSAGGPSQLTTTTTTTTIPPDSIYLDTHSAPSSSTSTTNTAPLGQVSFRRQRASRACATCHARKVRCDAAILGVPCTNCVAFQVECRIPDPKRKAARSTGQPYAKDFDNQNDGPVDSSLPDIRHRSPSTSSPCSAAVSGRVPPAPQTSTTTTQVIRPAVYHSQDGTPSTRHREDAEYRTYMNMVMKPEFKRPPITDAGRVAYLGETSMLNILNEGQEYRDVLHYPLPENIHGARAGLTELDQDEIEILKRRGAFLLPPRSLCDELVESYFIWVHPLVPVINRTRFMRMYKDSKNPPSLLLLQAVLLAGSRNCSSPQLLDANGSTRPAAMTFYKRAKALYDANYEDDRVTIVQSLILLSWYWEGPEDVTKNVFYWSRVAIIVAQGSGMHRSVESSQLSKADKRLWKRIWWTLFTRDRSVAVAFGRPVHINIDDSDVEMVTEEDFIEDDENPDEYPVNPVHVHFFLQYVKLCEIMGLVLSSQYSVSSKGRRTNPLDLTHSDMALADWLHNCPKIVYWEMPRHHFWSAILHSNYYTILCLLHRAHITPLNSKAAAIATSQPDSPYPSRNIACQAAAMITSIVENLSTHKELRHCPAFFVYSLFSALIMHVYQIRSPIPSIQRVTQDRVRSCMNALKEISPIWMVGQMIYTLFEAIIGNKHFEERLQKAARLGWGSGSNKAQATHAPSPSQPLLNPSRTRRDSAKRKYDEMNTVDFHPPPAPQPQESYERSQPQTPRLTAAKQPPPLPTTTMSMATATTTSAPFPSSFDSPHMRQTAADTFMGGTASRMQTRPSSPFNPTLAPHTPPDLYLVTRNSPNISLSLFENFQPDQLFPENTSFPQTLPPHLSPPSMPPPHTDTSKSNLVVQQRLENHDTLANNQPSNTTTLDPSHQQFTTTHGMSSDQMMSPMPPNSMLSAPADVRPPSDHGAFLQANFDGFDATFPDGQSPGSWSSGSQGQHVPSSLNVEDWFQFFGINGFDAVANNQVGSMSEYPAS